MDPGVEGAQHNMFKHQSNLLPQKKLESCHVRSNILNWSKYRVKGDAKDLVHLSINRDTIRYFLLF